MIASYSLRKSTYSINISNFNCSSRQVCTRPIAVSILTLLCIGVIATIIIVSIQEHGESEQFIDSTTFRSSSSATTQSLNDVTNEELQYVTDLDQHASIISETADTTRSTGPPVVVTDGASTAELLQVTLAFGLDSAQTQDKEPTESHLTTNGGNTSVTDSPTVIEQLLSTLSTPETRKPNNESTIHNEKKDSIIRYVQAFYGKYTYLLFGNRATFDEARVTCEQLNSTLIYIESNEEEEMFNDLVFARMSLVSSAPVIPTGQQNSTTSVTSDEMTMWTAGYANSASITKVQWNSSSIRSSYERFCQGEVSTINAKLKKTGENRREIYRIVKEFNSQHKENVKWRETNCWRLIEETALRSKNTTMHFACKHKSLLHDTKSSPIKLLAPLRQMRFFTLATFSEAEALCDKSNATLISIESEEDDEAIDRRVLARKAEFLSDPSIPSEALWSTRSPWMLWTSGVYDLASESMRPWKWANRHGAADAASYAGKFCDGALDRARAFWRSDATAAPTGLVHIVKDYSGAGNCWQLLDPLDAALGNYTLPVMCQSRVPSGLFARKN